MADRTTGPLSQPGAPAPAAEKAPARADEGQPASGRHDESGRLGEGGRTDVFEVFRQEKDGDPMRHAGNIVAPDIGLAMHYARELYSRRQESVRLWVVPRTQITDLSDPDLLQPPLDRSFKKPGGYVMRDKLEVAKQRAANEKATADQPGGER
jgi:ring-1,2-phenylacetyl-CoA epoxidase subunit PaaB